MDRGHEQDVTGHRTKTTRNEATELAFLNANECESERPHRAQQDNKVDITLIWPHVACIIRVYICIRSLVLDKPAPRSGPLYRTAVRCQFQP